MSIHTKGWTYLLILAIYPVGERVKIDTRVKLLTHVGISNRQNIIATRFTKRDFWSMHSDNEAQKTFPRGSVTDRISHKAVIDFQKPIYCPPGLTLYLG